MRHILKLNAQTPFSKNANRFTRRITILPSPFANAKCTFYPPFLLVGRAVLCFTQDGLVWKYDIFMNRAIFQSSQPFWNRVELYMIYIVRKQINKVKHKQSVRCLRRGVVAFVWCGKKWQWVPFQHMVTRVTICHGCSPARSSFAATLQLFALLNNAEMRGAILPRRNHNTLHMHIVLLERNEFRNMCRPAAVLSERVRFN